MFQQVCHQIQIWKKITNNEIIVSYNLSLASLRIKDEATFIINELMKNNIDGKHINIEITETLFYEENTIVKNNINLLKEYGIKIALDDFGINFSTLSMLDRIAYDIIKIDMYFTQNLGAPSSNLLINMIKNISKINNKRCIVEGIETHAQFLQLSEFGLTEFQGHYFNKPLTSEEISEKIKNNSLFEVPSQIIK